MSNEVVGFTRASASRIAQVVRAVERVPVDRTRRHPPRVIGGGSSLLRPCTLTQTSGNDGTASAACSWVYTVTDALTGEEVATGRSPAHRRLYGTTYYATIGTYYLDSEGTCILHWTDEQPKPFGCTTA